MGKEAHGFCRNITCRRCLTDQGNPLPGGERRYWALQGGGGYDPLLVLSNQSLAMRREEKNANSLQEVLDTVRSKKAT